MIKLELSVEEVNGILAVLGDLPTKTGAWVLLSKIKEQAESQVQAGYTNNANGNASALYKCSNGLHRQMDASTSRESRS
jgi:hypothetical protein